MAKGALIEHKKKPIKNLIGFIKSSSDMLGLGLWKKEQEKQQEGEGKATQVQEREQEQVVIQRIIDEYDKRAKDEFLKKYNEMTDDERAEVMENLKNQSWSRILFTDGEINENGQIHIGQLAIFGNDYDRKQKIINYAFKFHQVQLKQDYNQKTDFSFQ